MLIGFIGKMGSGKSTAADFLVQNYGFVKHNFKDALDKELVALYPNIITTLTGLPPEEGVMHKPTSPAMRELKQRHGTDIRRGQDEDYWVGKWCNHYSGFTKNANVCVDDVRFLNEVEAIKRFGGVIVRIKRTDITDTGDHPSETALDSYEADYTITADKGDHLMVYMSLENIIENDSREEDSDDSGPTNS